MQYGRYKFSYIFNEQSSKDLILSSDSADEKMKVTELIFICNDALLRNGRTLAAIGGLTLYKDEGKFDFSCSEEFADNMRKFSAIRNVEKITGISPLSNIVL